MIRHRDGKSLRGLGVENCVAAYRKRGVAKAILIVTGKLDERADGLFRLSVSGNIVVGAKLLLTELAQGNERLLVANGGVNYDPAFAPDGYAIVFVSTVTGRDELYRINRDGGCS